jgi:hypothetical protein
MKTLILVVLVLSPAALAAAQTPSSQVSAPGVSVVELRWSRQSLPSPALYEDPLRAAEEQTRLDSARNEVIQQNRIRAQVGVEQIRVPTNNGLGNAGARRHPSASPYVYLYEVKLNNTGAKKIRRLSWEYTFTDESNGAVAGQHQFTHEVSLRPGRSKKLVGRSNLPPSLVVNAVDGGKKSPSGYSEKVSILRVEFDDGTAWDAPPQ